MAFYSEHWDSLPQAFVGVGQSIGGTPEEAPAHDGSGLLDSHPSFLWLWEAQLPGLFPTACVSAHCQALFMQPAAAPFLLCLASPLGTPGFQRSPHAHSPSQVLSPRNPAEKGQTVSLRTARYPGQVLDMGPQRGG